MICADTDTTTVSLAPVETAGGRKMLVVPLNATSAVVAEYRRAAGFDAALPVSGPVVYLVDTSVATGFGPLRVLPADDTDVRKLSRVLAVGQTLTHAGVSIRYVSGDAAGVTLEVVRP